MGIFDLLKRRRDPDGAVAPARMAPLQTDPAPTVGEPVGQAFPAAGPELFTSDAVHVGGLFGLIARHVGEHSEATQVDGMNMLDVRNALGMRDQMMDAMRQHGIDPSGKSQINVSDAQGLQQQIMSILEQHGVDVNALQQQAAAQIPADLKAQVPPGWGSGGDSDGGSGD